MSTGLGVATVDARAALTRVLAVHRLLADGPDSDVVAVADAVVGLHGTSPATAYLSLYARIPGFRPEDLDRELYRRASLLRLKGVRGSVFLLSRELAPIVFAATHRLTVERDRRWLGIDEHTYLRAAPAVVAALAGRSLSVAELRKTVTVDADLSAVVALLCDEGRLERDRPVGSRKSSTFRYRRWEDAVPGLRLDSYDETEATRLLVDRYIRGYGPVTVDDVVWWSGLPAPRVRAAIGGRGAEITAVAIRGVPGTFLMREADLDAVRQAEPLPAHPVRLLPELDPLTMGYRNRSRLLDPADAERVIDRGGNATSVVLIEGRIAGVWDLTDRPAPAVRVLLFHPRPRELAQVTAAAAEVGQFWLGTPAPVRHYTSMVPLTRRGGWVRHPLDGATPLDADPPRRPRGTAPAAPARAPDDSSRGPARVQARSP